MWRSGKYAGLPRIPDRGEMRYGIASVGIFLCMCTKNLSMATSMCMAFFFLDRFYLYQYHTMNKSRIDQEKKASQKALPGMFCGSSAKPSIATTAASEVSPSVPLKDDPAEPPTDDKDTSPKPSARSGSSPSPSVPGNASSILCESSAKPSIATTAASEVSPSVPPEVFEPPPSTARRASQSSPATSQAGRRASPRQYGQRPTAASALRSCSKKTKKRRKKGGQVKLILSPKQRAKPAASRTRTCTNTAVCIASGECPSRF